MTATVEAPPNSVPVAGDDEATTPEDMALVVDVLAKDSDADGDALPGTGLVALFGRVGFIESLDIVMGPCPARPRGAWPPSRSGPPSGPWVEEEPVAGVDGAGHEDHPACRPALAGM